MLEKNEITRKHLKSNIMKQIIMRVDYQGVLDNSKLAEVFSNQMKGRFEKREITFHNRIDIDTTRLNEISETLSVPVREIEKQEITRFSYATFGPDELTLDVGKYYTCLTIDCRQYSSIDPYLTFFVEMIGFFYQVEDYLDIKRIGLRKIGGKIFNSIQEINADFELRFFNFSLLNEGFSTNSCAYKDEIQESQDGPNVNFIRILEKGYLRENNAEKEAYQVILDLDGYYNEESLNQLGLREGKSDLASNLLRKTNDESLFRIFKMSVTKEFLNANCHHE